MAVKRLSPQKTVEPVARRLAEEFGLELVEVEFVAEPQSGGARFLRVLMDREGGVDLDTCEKYHRLLIPLVEHIDYDYLEVGSPGADRPLKTPRDFERAMGKRVEMRLYKPVNGRKIIEGVLRSFTGDGIGLETPAGLKLFAKNTVAIVRPAISMEEPEPGGREDERAAKHSDEEDAGK